MRFDNVYYITTGVGHEAQPTPRKRRFGIYQRIRALKREERARRDLRRAVTSHAHWLPWQQHHYAAWSLR